MENATAVTRADAVVCEIDIAAPPERVFEALTDPKQLAVWWSREPSTELLEFKMESHAGGLWRFRGRAAAGHDHGEVGKQLAKNQATEFEAHGEVVEIVPPRLLVWTWIANWHEHPLEKTVVRWELSPISGGTRVRVTHSELAQEPVSRADYGQGWVGVLRLLKTFVEEK